MTHFFQSIGAAVATGLIAFASLFATANQPIIPQIDSASTDAPSAQLGASNALETPVALFETSLANSISSSATSMTLVSGLTKDGTTLASSTYSFVIDEGTASEEFVIADCTSTVCTNMQRGLSVLTGTTTVASLQFTHRRGASVKITDAPILLKISRIVNGISTLPNPLHYATPLSGIGSDLTAIPDVNYVNGVAGAGAADASPTVKGIVEEATALEASSGAADGSGNTSAPLALTSGIATSTCQSAASRVLVASSTTGKLAGNCLDSNYSYTFNAPVTFTSTTTISTILGIQPIYGDGSDGASTTAASYALTRDVYLTNYTVSNGNTITPNGHRIYVSGTLTVAGTISANGGTGGTGGAGGDQASAGAGAAGASGAPGVSGGAFSNIVGGLAGGAGATGGVGASSGGNPGNSSSALAQPYSWTGVNGSIGGAGGTGGNSGCSTVGGGTSATSTATQIEKPVILARIFNPSLAAGTSTLQLGAQSVGGAGGGGGCNTGVNSTDGGGGGGGGGGGNGGELFIAAKTISVSASGVISANGGAGGTGGRGGNATGAGSQSGGGGGGGGGGGNGGLIFLLYQNSLTNAGSIVVTGGAGGALGAAGSSGGSAGTAGTAGGAGLAGLIKALQY